MDCNIDQNCIPLVRPVAADAQGLGETLMCPDPWAVRVDSTSLVGPRSSLVYAANQEMKGLVTFNDHLS